MIIAWSRRLPAAVRELRSCTPPDTGHLPAGGHLLRAALADGTEMLLDADGCPVRGHPTAPPAGPPPRPPAEAVHDGCRVALLFDGTVIESVDLRSPVTHLVPQPGGPLLAAATEEGDVYGLRFALTADVAAALRDAEETWLKSDPGDRPAIPPYDEPGLRFRADRLVALHRAGKVDEAALARGLAALARDPAAARLDTATVFLLAEAVQRGGAPDTALPLYQRAAVDQHLRSRALKAAADCLHTLGARRAADLAYRRSAVADPGEPAKHVMYESARRLAETGRSQEARLGYELLLSWDAAFGDVQKRLAALPRHGTETPGGGAPGATVDALNRYGVLPPSVEHTVSFDASWYHNFDATSAADSAKKLLEMVGIFTAVDIGSVRRSLDIGSGTLRYPKALAACGVESVGIDLSTAGVREMPREAAKRFVCADGTRLPFRDGVFDLVTCAMGTVDHLPPGLRAALFAQTWRVLAPGGVAAVGAWDPRCPHLTFLEMYSAAERDQLRGLLVPPDDLVALARRQGFEDVTALPFAMFPDWVAAGAGLDTDVPTWLRALAEWDAVARARDASAAGQMFLLIARKPDLRHTAQEGAARRS
ncbi:methyltransferase domain-containing protein [Streptomyces sp. NPDC046915]|uniref:methyltransferase domain-containing protein n=1 Tax=Streptomyces sp. NPDC046915 TaxID=3155257 RepID=UPI0033C70ADC